MNNADPARKLALIYTALTALGVSLILGYLVTEMQVRLFYNNAFALFVVASLSLGCAYLLGYLRGRHSGDAAESEDTLETPDSISKDQ